MELKKIGIGCGSLFSGCLVIIFVFFFLTGVAVEQGLIPDAVAQPKGKIPQRQLDKLVELGVVEEDETVEFFYSSAFFDMEKDGNLFTNQRVISYQKTDDELMIYQAAYPEIAELDFTASESWESDSSITVTTKEGDWFLLIVSPQDNMDDLFYDRLLKRWKQAGENAP